MDIHEGCGRAKFFWALAVADSKLLKAMVEFRVGNLKSNNNKAAVANSGEQGAVNDSPNNAFYQSEICRFCGSEDAIDMLGLGFVCSSEDCQKFAGEACTKVLECSHACYGILNELVCLPCLHDCSGVCLFDYCVLMI